jgi:hypothetical protein
MMDTEARKRTSAYIGLKSRKREAGKELLLSTAPKKENERKGKALQFSRGRFDRSFCQVGNYAGLALCDWLVITSKIRKKKKTIPITVGKRNGAGVKLA